MRELIDAGVFVFSGGAPRAKTRHADPVLQFILSYRKIYGLASFIGLSDRDRFELSGEDLRKWLEADNLASAKEILLRNQINKEVDSTTHEDDRADEGLESAQSAAAADDKGSARQIELFQAPSEPSPAPKPQALAERAPLAEIREVSLGDISRFPVETVFAGLGFEDRAVGASHLLTARLAPKAVLLAKYKLPGFSDEITQEWKAGPGEVNCRDYEELRFGLPEFRGLSLVDVSGLAKPLIFSAVRRELIEKREVLVCHAQAETYYPLQEDLEALFAAERANEPVALLESLAKVLMGEEGPYTDQRLLKDESDVTRNRALLAFASAKHERLFSLLDRREYDQVEIIASAGDSPRARVARIAAEFVAKNFPNTKIAAIESDDLRALVSHLDAQYMDLYQSAGANLEIGLTGSKTQAVAAAILSARRKVSQAWYLSPKTFDPKRYSKGMRGVRIFHVSVP
jgi:hypothetical protein